MNPPEEQAVPTVTVEDAQTRLPELIEQLPPGETLVITRGNRPVARLVAEGGEKRQPRVPGSAKGMLVIVADDDHHLKDFAEYMP